MNRDRLMDALAVLALGAMLILAVALGLSDYLRVDAVTAPAESPILPASSSVISEH